MLYKKDTKLHTITTMLKNAHKKNKLSSKNISFTVNLHSLPKINILKFYHLNVQVFLHGSDYCMFSFVHILLDVS